jgi:hypothetical protein
MSTGCAKESGGRVRTSVRISHQHHHHLPVPGCARTYRQGSPWESEAERTVKQVAPTRVVPFAITPGRRPPASLYSGDPYVAQGVYGYARCPVAICPSLLQAATSELVLCPSHLCLSSSSATLRGRHRGSYARQADAGVGR